MKLSNKRSVDKRRIKAQRQVQRRRRRYLKRLPALRVAKKGRTAKRLNDRIIRSWERELDELQRLRNKEAEIE